MRSRLHLHKARMTKNRQNSQMKMKEAENQKIRRQNLKNKQFDRIRKANLRQNPQFKSAEAANQKIRRRNLADKEKEKLKIYQNFIQSRWRQDKFNRFTEKLANRRRMEVQRNNRSYRLKQRKVVRHLVCKLRKDKAYTDNERRLKIDSNYRQKLLYRLQHNRKLQQEQSGMMRKGIIANQIQSFDEIDKHDVLKTQRIYRNQLQEQLKSSSSIIRQKIDSIKLFISERSETPKYICLCCEGLFFHNSVVLTTEQEREDLAPNQSMFTTNHICTTCRKQYKSNRLPTLAVKNGLEYPVLPECLKESTEAEQRLCAPMVPFMNVTELTPYSLNSQLGIKGSVINIPVSVPEMVSVLPRSMNEMQTIQLKFKRRLAYKSNYMFETISPKHIRDCLAFLIQQPLYRENEITIDDEMMQHYNQNEDGINFIIDSNDENALVGAAKNSIAISSIDVSNAECGNESDDEPSSKSGSKSLNKPGLKLRNDQGVNRYQNT